jgi:hypothetical protein
MRRVLFLSITAVLCLSALFAFGKTAGASERHGAVVFSEEDGAWGFIVKMPSKEMAEKEALASCQARKGTSCAVKGDFTNCGALAIGEGVYGIGSGDTKEIAEKNAMEACGAQGTGCKIAASDSNQ